MSFSTQDPLTGKFKSSYDYAAEEGIFRSIEILHSSFINWRNESLKKRQDILSGSAVKLKTRKDYFADLITAEMGKPIKESRLEVKKCIDLIERICAMDLGFLEPRNVSRTFKSKISHEPLGVIYSIMPWNLPLWQVLRMAMPALLSGNTILLKHAEITPLMAVAIEDLFKDLYVTPLVLQNYSSHEQTDYILKNSKIGGVSLTGSVPAGRIVYQTAAHYFKKAVLELGGSDPYIVMADADIKMAAKKIAKGRLLNNGQVCISVKRVIVDKAVLDPFLSFLKLEFDQYIIGDPADAKTDLGPLAHTRLKDHLKKQIVELQKNSDAELVYSKPHNQPENSAYVNPEIYLLSENTDWLRDQEFFGPVLLVIPFADISEAVQIANSTDFALSAGVFSENLENAGVIAEQMIAGQVAINEIIATDLDLPFGGFKNSGLGRELGIEGFLEFSQTKVIVNI